MSLKKEYPTVCEVSVHVTVCTTQLSHSVFMVLTREAFWLVKFPGSEDFLSPYKYK